MTVFMTAFMTAFMIHNYLNSKFCIDMKIFAVVIYLKPFFDNDNEHGGLPHVLPLAVHLNFCVDQVEGSLSVTLTL